MSQCHNVTTLLPYFNYNPNLMKSPLLARNFSEISFFAKI
jgi:hypothetical protein